MPSHAERRFEQVPLASIATLRSADSPKVLHVSPIPLLLETRSAVLEAAGVRTVSAGSVAAAVRLCRRHSFNAVVLCHELSRQQKEQVMRAARRNNTATTVIGLYNLVSTEAKGADLAVDSHDGPEALLQAVRSAL